MAEAGISNRKINLATEKNKKGKGILGRFSPYYFGFPGMITLGIMPVVGFTFTFKFFTAGLLVSIALL